MKRKIILAICILSLIISSIGSYTLMVKADEDVISYSLGENADISYKKSENKVYYNRSHYSSGSGIKYYTQYFVISLQEAEMTDDLSTLDMKSGEYSRMLLVGYAGSSISESESSKTGDFYWYDSEANDEGYVKTTYVIDGDVFLQLLNAAGKEDGDAEIYIHHVFAVTGGKESDDWHKENGVTNEVPYFKYSELMKLKWNDTVATHNSQKACLNIKVPYVKEVYVEPKKLVQDVIESGPNPYIRESGSMDINPFAKGEATPEPTPNPTTTQFFLLTSVPANISSVPIEPDDITPTTSLFDWLGGIISLTDLGLLIGQQPSPTPVPAPTQDESLMLSPTPAVTGSSSIGSPFILLTSVPGYLSDGTLTSGQGIGITLTPAVLQTVVETPSPILETVTQGQSIITPEPIMDIVQVPIVTAAQILTDTPTPTPTPRGDISVDIVTDDLKYVQRLDTDKEYGQVVIGKSAGNKLTLDITNYGSDIRISFPFDIYNGDGMLLPANTWNVYYDSYIVPDSTDEGKYNVRVAAVDSDTGLFSAYDEGGLEVSGRMYGLELVRVNSVAPEWKGVFDDGRYRCSVGLKDDLGNDKGITSSKILPLVDGDSPINPAGGMLKSGYTWTFELSTLGSVMEKSGAHIVIVPSFYYISGLDDVQTREKVRVYDMEVEEIAGTVEATSMGKSGNETVWRFEYSLPDKWYCTSQNNDIEAYVERIGGVTFRENFWKKKGYLAVNFEIGAYDESGKLIMTYANNKENVASGMCDMWAMEGRMNTKVDCYGQSFRLEEGDVVLLRLPGSTYDRNGMPSPPTNASEDKTVTQRGN